MILLFPPTKEQVQALLGQQRDLPFSYPDVGATEGTPPAGYWLQHNRVLLGHGADTWERAVAAVRRWEMFHLGWVRIYWPHTPLKVGSTVAVSSRQLGFWTLNAARIVYLVEEDGPIRRFGFAYGTLPGHVERGEERFTVEWHRDDDAVWYDILAFSRPHHLLTWLGYPVARSFQKRFARDSKRAMLAAVGN